MTEFFFAVSRLRENKKTVILREAKRSRRIQIPMLWRGGLLMPSPLPLSRKRERGTFFSASPRLRVRLVCCGSQAHRNLCTSLATPFWSLIRGCAWKFAFCRI